MKYWEGGGRTGKTKRTICIASVNMIYLLVQIFQFEFYLFSFFFYSVMSSGLTVFRWDFKHCLPQLSVAVLLKFHFPPTKKIYLWLRYHWKSSSLLTVQGCYMKSLRNICRSRFFHRKRISVQCSNDSKLITFLLADKVLFIADKVLLLRITAGKNGIPLPCVRSSAWMTRLLQLDLSQAPKSLVPHGVKMY